MTCSPARLAANRANALKSTGPKEGKVRSRMNALKHGLAAEVLRTEEEHQALAATPLAGWLEGEAAVLAMRIDRAREVEERERDRAALRAETCWEEDRHAEAGRVARGLARHPDRVAARLRGTMQGCAWMIERWEWLLAAAGKDGGWDAEQRSLADDLRGIPHAFRAPKADADGQAATAAGQVAALVKLRDALGRSDAFERQTTKLKLDDGATPELRRAIRYEAALHRRLRWCLEQLGSGEVPEAPAAARRQPEPASAPAPSPEPRLTTAAHLFKDLPHPLNPSAGLDERVVRVMTQAPAFATGTGVIPVSMTGRRPGR